MDDLNKLRDIDALKISLASADEIISWSHGEVTKPETINYRTLKPEKGGLFCERIFGPVKDYECYCGKYKRIRYKGVICDRCGVQVTTSKVRRERMGHIVLASPVVHVWFFRNIPSILSTLLGIPPRSLELVIYFSSYVVTEIDTKAKETILENFEQKVSDARKDVHKEIENQIKEIEKEVESKVKSLSKNPESKWDEKLKAKAKAIRQKAQEECTKLRDEELIKQDKVELILRKIEKKLNEVELHTVMTDREYIDLEEYLDQFCKVSIGAEAVSEILENLDIKKLAKELKKDLETTKGAKTEKLKKRLMVVESFMHSNVDPRSMVITVLPVIPPDLRPMVQLEGGRFATSDLNDLYRRIINRNNRLRRLVDLGAPEMIIRNEKRMLQESVDALIDSSKVRKTRARDRKTYRSLADAIKGKQGYFRANLLGKRVDYSGRAVIVPGPHLKMNECGVPTEMALELFRPFLIREIMRRGLAPNMKTAKYVLEDKKPEVYAILEELIKQRPVILNRAPTLHRLSIQAFYPRLTEGKAIQLHPVVCAGYNADFDGDQMAIHLPLSEKAVKEAEKLMISTKNLLKPADASVVTIPSHEMVLGLYYLTSVNKSMGISEIVFSSFDEVLRAHGNKKLPLRKKIRVRVNGEIIETTAGQVILNQFIPEELEYVDVPLSKGEVQKLIKESMEVAGWDKTVELIDHLKYYGFKYSTNSGVSLSIFDCVKPQDLDEVMKKAHEEVDQIEQNYHMGLITRSEFSKLSQKVWASVVDHLDQTVLDHIEEENPVKLIISAKAGKASATQIRQISAIKGIIADPGGRTIDMPVLGNYSVGMSSFDYFLTGRGTRRSYMDKGLGTADAGYLTRRLVNVAQDVLVRETDCRTTRGRVIKRGQDTPLHPWYERIIGRYAAEDVKDGRKILVKRDELITKDIASEIEKSKAKEVKIRSAITCNTQYGVCSKCYGVDLTSNKVVDVGTAVGIIAAQSIGEPGTQLTLNVFHSGGIALENITQGLPRVEELFEVRKPKVQAKMSTVAGKVKIVEEDEGVKIVIKPSGKDSDEVVFDADFADDILVQDGDLVGIGTVLTAGSLNPNELYEVVGPDETQLYIIEEVQKVYGSQGVSINDKHAEIIVRQMFNRVKIVDEGDTNLLAGKIVIKYKLDNENKRVSKLGGQKATAEPILLGISKASRKSESWLDAASFEETSSVLTENAITGSVDHLIGLKENVIIGRRLPIGEDVKVKDIDTDLDESK